MKKLEQEFDYIKINIASPSRIRQWGARTLPNGQVVGEVIKPETINYRTFKPEMDGLFCERIFGPIKNWECHCGKYRRVRHRGLICDRCGVEVTESRIRRHRMGFIDLIAPVTHVWYLKGLPSYISLIIDMKPKDLERVAYFNEYITSQTSKSAHESYTSEILPNLQPPKPFVISNLDNPSENFSIEDNYLGDYDQSTIGAEAILKILENLNVVDELAKSREEILKAPSIRKEKLIKRIRILENFFATGSNPAWMILSVLPVIPPGLRPMVQLDGGRFATSDLNELYRRVITRNNRLSRLLEIYAPEIIIRNEKRMLQESVDALIDNGKRGKRALGINNRPLKSLSDIIEGKQGRFRQNLLGKRVDYSGRSVIIVGPELKLNQCGLPREMAIELFQPFVIHRLIFEGLVNNIKAAKKHHSK
jgi:DNA-directed RNA polymerase subunit beta'